MDPINLFDYEKLAKNLMRPEAWDFVDAGCNDEVTKNRNRIALDEVLMQPNFLVDVGVRNLKTTVLGQEISFPVMIAPAGSQTDAHPDGEIASARAAGKSRTIYALPTASGHGINEVAATSTGPLWFQLYHYNNELTEYLLSMAKTAMYSAICVTVDTPVPSPKERDIRNNHSGPEMSWGSLKDRPDLLPARSVGSPDTINWNPTGYVGLTWDKLDWIRSLTGLPLVIKGIRTVGDALRCVEHGVDGIVVSNHGGRQFDGTFSAIETLPSIAESVEGKLEVYFDSGIRRGLDVLRALALGARAVMIGRPVFWGLAVDGEAGVTRVLELLRLEFDRALAYCGLKSVHDIDRSLVSIPRNWSARI